MKKTIMDECPTRNFEFRGSMKGFSFDIGNSLLDIRYFLGFLFWEMKKPPDHDWPGGRGRIRLGLLIRHRLNRGHPVFAFLVVRIRRTTLDANALAVFVIVHRPGFGEVDAAAELVVLIHRRIANTPAVAGMEVYQLALHPRVVGSMRKARLGRDVHIRAAAKRVFFA